jgi:hypothetical protein
MSRRGVDATDFALGTLTREHSLTCSWEVEERWMSRKEFEM